jgi:clan AA aspartic protease
MRTKGARAVGRFSVDVYVANFVDIASMEAGVLPPEKVRRVEIRGVVDSGATQLVLPQTVVNQLGLNVKRKVQVGYADGRTAVRDVVQGVYLELMGRNSTFAAIVEPGRRSALIGAVVLEVLDLLVDCTHQQLLPRDPDVVVTEIE